MGYGIEAKQKGVWEWTTIQKGQRTAWRHNIKLWTISRKGHRSLWKRKGSKVNFTKPAGISRKKINNSSSELRIHTCLRTYIWVDKIILINWRIIINHGHRNFRAPSISHIKSRGYNFEAFKETSGFLWTSFQC